MKNNILLVEDSTHIQLLVKNLMEPICNLTVASNLQTANLQLKENNFSMILLDVMLPDGSGYDYCETLRKDEKFRETPIIFLTGKSEIEDRVRGFKVGADDYLVKPIEPKEFIARIESRLKRYAVIYKTEMTVGAFHLNSLAQKAFLKIDGADKDLDLTPIEFKLLSNFMRKYDKVINREEIKISVWGDAVHVTSHTIDTHISSLRKKIEPCGKYIRSIVKRGYVFSPPNEEIAS